MKFPTFVFCICLLGATAAQADVVNRREQCGKWEYIPASKVLGNPETALLFCSDEETTWMSLRIECLAEEKRIAVTYRPGYIFTPPTLPEVEFVAAAEITETDAEITNADGEIIEDIPFVNPAITSDSSFPDAPREMVFFDFRSFGYTGVAYFLAENSDWKFYEPEPLSPVFSRLITGNYADISLMATGITERLPLRGSGKALRPVVETCRLAKETPASPPSPAPCPTASGRA